jgi:hypothetical protein
MAYRSPREVPGRLDTRLDTPPIIPSLPTFTAWLGQLVQGIVKGRPPLGTMGFSSDFSFMDEPFLWLIEKSIQIAWDYLERTGELRNAAEASRFLLKTVDQMIVQGER